MKDGWIKSWRSLLDSEVFGDSDLLKLWILCLHKATYEEYDQVVGLNVVKLIPGQFVTGRFALHEEYYEKSRTPKNKRLSPLTLWRYLKLLEKMENLNIKTTNKYSIISIVNWEKYQGDPGDLNNNRTSNDHQEIIKRSQTRSIEEEEGKNSDEEKKFSKEKKEEIRENIKSVVKYLNKKSGSEFKPSTKGTQDVIKARLNDGFTVSDFELVIDFKVEQWMGDSKYSEFLRPKTLFGNKMEGYLQGAKKYKFDDPYICKGCNRKFEKKVSKHEGLCDECLHKAR